MYGELAPMTVASKNVMYLGVSKATHHSCNYSDTSTHLRCKQVTPLFNCPGMAVWTTLAQIPPALLHPD